MKPRGSQLRLPNSSTLEGLATARAHVQVVARVRSYSGVCTERTRQVQPSPVVDEASLVCTPLHNKIIPYCGFRLGVSVLCCPVLYYSRSIVALRSKRSTSQYSTRSITGAALSKVLLHNQPEHLLQYRPFHPMNEKKAVVTVEPRPCRSHPTGVTPQGLKNEEGGWQEDETR